MPRDLMQERDNLSIERKETTENDTQLRSGMMATNISESPSPQPETKGPENNAVKPYVQSLTMLDLDSCVKLEEATFPPQERCTREKFIYRFTKCGELSIGLFTSADTSKSSTRSSDPINAATVSTSQPVYSGTPHRKQVLLAHIVATKTDHQTIADDDMALPPNWQPTSPEDPKVGHKERGRTVCVHSLAVLPEFQQQGLGRLLMRSYIQRIESSGIADRIAIITHKELVDFYEGLGFENRGESKAQFGGGNWVDMVIDLKEEQ